MSYCVQYSARMAERLKQEADNLNIYQSAGKQYMAAKSAYILQHYSDRSVSSFYLMDSWESLLAFDFSDLLILLLLVLGIAASFTREKETGMTMLLASSKRGGFPMLGRQMRCGSFLCSRTDDAFFTVKSHSIWGSVWLSGVGLSALCDNGIREHAI